MDFSLQKNVYYFVVLVLYKIY